MTTKDPAGVARAVSRALRAAGFKMSDTRSGRWTEGFHCSTSGNNVAVHYHCDNLSFQHPRKDILDAVAKATDFLKKKRAGVTRDSNLSIYIRVSEMKPLSERAQQEVDALAHVKDYDEAIERDHLAADLQDRDFNALAAVRAPIGQFLSSRGTGSYFKWVLTRAEAANWSLGRLNAELRKAGVL